MDEKEELERGNRGKTLYLDESTDTKGMVRRREKDGAKVGTRKKES